MSLNGKRPASILRKKASRKNGTKSKGPITESGKANSRRNALKHGLLSSVVVLDDAESQESLRSVVQDLCNGLNPEGALEEILVEEIAVCYWRLRRPILAEIGEISAEASREISDLVAKNERLAMEVNLDLYNWSKDEEMGYRHAAEQARELKRTAAGIGVILNWIGSMLISVERHGYYLPEYDGRVAVLFADEPVFYRHLNGLNQETRELGERAKNDKDCDTPGTQQLVQVNPRTLIKLKIEELEKRRKGLEKQEALQVENLRRSLSLPTGGSAERLLRYETTIKKHLYKAIDQLERLQRKRKGEYVPPPLKVEVEKEG